MKLTKGNIIVAAAIAVGAGIAGTTLQQEVYAGVESMAADHASVGKQPRLASAVSEHPCAGVVWPYVPAECLSHENEDRALVSVVRIASR